MIKNGEYCEIKTEYGDLWGSKIMLFSKMYFMFIWSAKLVKMKRKKPFVRQALV